MTPRPGASARRGMRLADLAGVAPPMLLFCVFIIVPMVAAIVLSFVRWNGLGTPQWAGGSNWAEFFRDPVARTSVAVTVKVVVLSYVVQTPISIALGLFTAGRQRYRSVYATIYVLPLLMSTAGIALTWESLLDPNFGALTALSRSWHLAVLQQNWLGSPDLTLYVIVAIIAWQFIPFHTLLYAVGRRQIPSVLYEAARIDGASPAGIFWRVTLPQLRYTIVTSGILMIVGALTYFDIIYILTDGGPGYTTRVLSLDMYNVAFVQDQYGYASVLAVILGVIGIAVAVSLVRFSGFASMASQQEGAA
ncbi:MAG TPA: sugar ABC transporter permease [Streptosporangiaceae bacterium]|nr:sugar ABC transporter permease [Streptosporangiaceae bacterium]